MAIFELKYVCDASRERVWREILKDIGWECSLHQSNNIPISHYVCGFGAYEADLLFSASGDQCKLQAHGFPHELCAHLGCNVMALVDVDVPIACNVIGVPLLIGFTGRYTLGIENISGEPKLKTYIGEKYVRYV